MITKIDKGARGEIRAEKFLRKNGYRIIERNFKNRIGEIDIIALQKNCICFIEVRTRYNIDDHSDALESVGKLKQRKLSMIALSYLKNKNWLDRRARFDVVSVILNNGKTQLRLIEDAFEAGV